MIGLLREAGGGTILHRREIGVSAGGRLELAVSGTYHGQ